MFKKLLIVFAMVPFSSCGSNKPNAAAFKDLQIQSLSLEGKKFCRTFLTGGILGQPAGERTHCIAFGPNKTVTDNASTIFGNPPENGVFSIQGNKITLTLGSRGSSYSVVYHVSHDGKTITSEAGAVLTLVEMAELANTTFCRKVSTGGLFGQPAGERDHCISFSGSVNVTDNASTFFGNPPELGVYEISGNGIMLKLKSISGSYSVKYTLSDDGLTLTGDAGAILFKQ